ncbi:MAG TPA: hypothetical protein VF678_13695, partial [bacterium]
MPASTRYAIVAIWPVLLLVLAGLLPAFPQDPSYHQYADQRTLFGIAHFWNVMTNVAIAAAGLMGLVTLAKERAITDTAVERWLWVGVFSAVVLTAWGSVTYHSRPNVFTLYWDRLPITITLALLMAVNLAERVSARAALGWTLPLLILGTWSTAHWIGTESAGVGDLRFYFAFQLICLGGIPLLWALFEPRYSGRN